MLFWNPIHPKFNVQSVCVCMCVCDYIYPNALPYLANLSYVDVYFNHWTAWNVYVTVPQ